MKIIVKVKTTLWWFNAWILESEDGLISFEHEGKLKDGFKRFCKIASKVYTEQAWESWKKKVKPTVPKSFHKHIE